MSSGLLALLDDIAALAKVAAASLDDVAAAAGKAGAKAAGVVIDDAAVTPRYVVGFAAERELPIVGRIALGSLKNKLLFLLPGALLLGTLAPWAITPILMLGGAYLCYEGAEKLYEAVAPHGAHAHEAATLATAEASDPAALEEAKIRSAISTDFILSAEVMAIALATIPESGFVARAAVLAVVGIALTVLVYGAVALIVKADDAGLALARSGSGAVRALGRGIVAAMPPLLRALSVVGTAAMLWVGGGILLHGLEEYGLAALPRAIHGAAHAAGGALGYGGAALEWLVNAAAAGIVGLVVGAALIPVVGLLAPLFRRRTGEVGR